MSSTLIITPAYIPAESHLGYLDDAINSVTRLTDDVVHLVVADGSPIDPQDTVNSYSDSRIRLYKRDRAENDLHTSSNSLNQVINSILDGSNKAIGGDEEIKYLTILSYDDVMVNLKSRVETLSSPDTVVSVSDLITFEGEFYAKRKKVKSTNPQEYIERGRIAGLNHTSAVLALDFVKEMKKYIQSEQGKEDIFPPDICYGEDRAVGKLMIYLVDKMKKIISYVPEVGMLHRRDPMSLSSRLDSRKVEQDRKVVDELYYPSRRSKITNSTLFRQLYFNTIRPNHSMLRKIWGKVSSKEEREFVREFFADLHKVNGKPKL